MMKIMKRLLLLISCLMLMSPNAVNAKTTYSDMTQKYSKKGFSYQKIPSGLKKYMKGKSCQKNSQLKNMRLVHVKYYNFAGKKKQGMLIVHKKIAKRTVKVFKALYKIKYPIQEISLIDKYEGDDDLSMEHNNTSAFNYRRITGSSSLSDHARGLAIDINPRINPYVKNGKVLPSNGKVYKERRLSRCKGKYKAYMIHKNDKCYKIFKKYGFKWGGDYHSLKDYQHFYY